MNWIASQVFILSAAASLAFVPSTVVYEQEAQPLETHTPQVEELVEESVEETLKEQTYRIAGEFGVEGDTLWNLVLSESLGGTKRIGDGDKSCGVVHFHSDYYPKENSRCDDDEYILTRAAEMIRDGLSHRFTPCSCVQQVRIFVPDLPRGNARDFVPNTNMWDGDVVIYNYDGEYHLGYKESINVEEGYWIERGANLEPCKSYERKVYFDSSDVREHLVGFWKEHDDTGSLTIRD